MSPTGYGRLIDGREVEFMMGQASYNSRVERGAWTMSTGVDALNDMRDAEERARIAGETETWGLLDRSASDLGYAEHSLPDAKSYDGQIDVGSVLTDMKMAIRNSELSAAERAAEEEAAKRKVREAKAAEARAAAKAKARAIGAPTPTSQATMPAAASERVHQTTNLDLDRAVPSGDGNLESRLESAIAAANKRTAG
uniref:Uncharacterized protein n=1 Tax=Haptolina brevifila TaxID=156173 RepID=A0A7S2GU63_9EUKA